MIESGDKVLIIGEHPLRRCFEQQYFRLKCQVTSVTELGGQDVLLYDEFVLLSMPCNTDKLAQDNRMLALLNNIAKQIPAGSHRRPLAHLLLQSNHTLGLLQNIDLPDTVISKMDVYPFTLESLWSRVVVAKMPGEFLDIDYPSLDREPMLESSHKFVHLLVVGFSAMAQSIAIHAALVSHYPNHTDSSPLRTRISFMSNGMDSRRGEFITRYRSLFDNSYYSTLNLDNKSSSFHEPCYCGERNDFVDVEWEFIDGDFYSDEAQAMLKKLSTSNDRVLTIAVAHDNEDQNIKNVMALPGEVMENDIAVLVNVHNSESMSLLKNSDKFHNVFPFGMDDTGYDVRLPLMQGGKLLNAFYCDLIDVESEHIDQRRVDEAWKCLPSFAKRFSNVYSAMTIPSKMRSLGHDRSCPERFFSVSPHEVEIMAVVEHNRWCVEELILGFRPCTDVELKQVEESIDAFLAAKNDEEKIKNWKLRDKKGELCTLKEIFKEDETKRAHYDLCNYYDLRHDYRGVNVQEYDKKLIRCIPLLAHALLK